MNAIDNIERTLEEWGQNLRGGASTHGLQPRDVLSEVLKSLEENRVEGLDHKIYAPNAFSVNLRLDEEEKSRLLPFLGHDELESAIESYCRQRKYQFRGPLSLQVVDAGLSTAPPMFGAETERPADSTASATSDKKVLVQSNFDVPANYNSELASQFVIPERATIPNSEHDIERREPPTYAGSGRRN